MAKQTDDPIAAEYGCIIGGYITGVRAMTHGEIDQMAWFPNRGTTPIVLTIACHDGTREIITMCDPEGNGPGYLEITEIELLTAVPGEKNANQ